jgi:hypothetical protein
MFQDIDLKGEKVKEQEVVRLAMIDQDRKVRIEALLIEKNTPDGEEPDTITVDHVAGSVSDYVADKLTSKESNVVRNQIVPFVSQIMSKSIVKACGLHLAHFMLVSDLIKSAMIFNMTVAFLTFKFLQNNNYKIITKEEPVTDQEIADYKRMSKENETAALAAIMGLSVEEFREQMALLKTATGKDSKGNGGSDTVH